MRRLPDRCIADLTDDHVSGAAEHVGIRACLDKHRLLIADHDDSGIVTCNFDPDPLLGEDVIAGCVAGFECVHPVAARVVFQTRKRARFRFENITGPETHYRFAGDGKFVDRTRYGPDGIDFPVRGAFLRVNPVQAFTVLVNRL